MTLLTWLGILVCLTQPAMFSGMNLGLFSLSKLELEVEARKGDPRARRVLELRQNANLTLVTILWGNVGVNVLLALLSGSLLTGAAAFLLSIVAITVFAEIIPPAYFTRHALRLASLLAPVLRFYRILLYPVAWPGRPGAGRLAGRGGDPSALGLTAAGCDGYGHPETPVPLHRGPGALGRAPLPTAGRSRWRKKT